MEANGCGKEAGDRGRKGWGMQGQGWRGRNMLRGCLCLCHVSGSTACCLFQVVPEHWHCSKLYQNRDIGIVLNLERK
eukprot:1627219-Rhodomonas_salina.1